jgi:NTE family protein
MPATAVTRRHRDGEVKRTAGHRRARMNSRLQNRVGLALAGGGPLGGIYEVGALIALADSLDGLDFNDLDVYVGVSSGGFVAAALANGISPAQMYRLFIDDGAEAALSPGLFLRPAFGEFARRAASLPALLFRATVEYLRHPFQGSLLESMATLGRAVPTGLFNQRAIDAFLTRLLKGPGRSNDFRKLSRKLFLVATNLDTGASVTFGTPGWDHVPITKAIEASAALPGLFPPVEIDGVHYVDGALNKTLHASVALDEGVTTLICINPLVPFDASSASRRSHLTVEKLNQGGLPLVLAQTFRAIIHSRMKVGMEKYRRQYPHADILLFEPDREDADMFFANIFSYAHRKRLCEAAYHKTRQSLLARRATLEPQLAKRGVRLNLAHLDDADRAMHSAIDDPRPLSMRSPGVRQSARDLSHTLDHLDRWLARAR